jgi:hypothetical protein
MMIHYLVDLINMMDQLLKVNLENIIFLSSRVSQEFSTHEIRPLLEHKFDNNIDISIPINN